MYMYVSYSDVSLLFYLTCCMSLLQGEYVGARDNLEVALAVIRCPIPTSYYGIITGLLWSLFSHVLFQVDKLL